VVHESGTPVSRGLRHRLGNDLILVRGKAADADGADDRARRVFDRNALLDEPLRAATFKSLPLPLC